MFLTENDYKVVIGEASFRTVTQANIENLSNAEVTAIEEISGYLRPTYDCYSIFCAREDDRNRKIVQVACDIALWHLVSCTPAKMGYEIRKERYDEAIKWLEGVQKGAIMPDLPMATDNDGSPVGHPVIFGSTKRHKNEW